MIGVERRIFVPTTEAYARFYDSFTNNTGAQVTIIVTYESDLGSDSSTSLLRGGGDNTYISSDLYVITDDSTDGASGSDPVISLVHGQADAVSPVSTNQITYTQSYDLTIEDGETLSILQFASQTLSSPSALSSAITRALLLTFPSETTVEDLSLEERERTVNVALPINPLTDGEGFVWDINYTGTVIDGTDDAFDLFL